MLNRFHSFSSAPLHVTGRCKEDTWTSRGLNNVWRAFCRTLNKVHKDYEIQTHAFVMMSNHFHWLCVFDDFFDNESFFDSFQNSLSPRFSLFEGPAKIKIIDHCESYKQTYFYIYRNPILAGLCAQAERYPYSTLPMVLGEQKMLFPCSDQMNLIYHPQHILNQMNFN